MDVDQLTFGSIIALGAHSPDEEADDANKDVRLRFHGSSEGEDLVVRIEVQQGIRQ